MLKFSGSASSHGQASPGAPSLLDEELLLDELDEDELLELDEDDVRLATVLDELLLLDEELDDDEDVRLATVLELDELDEELLLEDDDEEELDVTLTAVLLLLSSGQRPSLANTVSLGTPLHPLKSTLWNVTSNGL